MNRIGLVTCKKRKNKVNDDKIVKDYLNKNGFYVDIVAWDDKRVEWDNYDVLLIRSVWNSSINYRKYCEFLLYIDNLNIKVINNVYTIVKNLCKKELNGLKYKIYIRNNFLQFKQEVLKKINKLPFESFVLKPMIGESSYHVFRYNRNGLRTKNAKSIKYITKKIYRDKAKYGNPGIIIEKFNEDIINGEYCVFYFNNKIVYCIKKYPSVFQERKEIEFIEKIPNEIVNFIKSNNFLDNGYGRIDLLYNKKVYLMEIEKNDPDLYIVKLPFEKQQEVLKEILKMIEGEIHK